MKYRKLILLALAAITIVVSCSEPSDSDRKQPYLVVLSMDGFRWDYAEMYDTPNLDRLAQKGVMAERMVPSFPTKTFPNHYTLATGLYPDNHGIVLNGFYDPETNRYYSIRDRDAVGDGSFYGGEPVWVTAEKQNVKSASLFWVGSEAEINGFRPSIWKNYDHGMPFEPRVDTVIKWLQLPGEIRPHLIMWYFHEPDSQGHETGPESSEVAEKVYYLDSLVGDFMNKLEKLPHASKVNFIVLSDHGMGATSDDRMIELSDYLQEGWIDEIQGGNPIFVMKAKAGTEDQLYQALLEIPHTTAWKSSEIPDRLHYGTNPRTLDFVIVADSAWSISHGQPGSYNGGAHGYDNRNADMNAIFYGMGPAFKKGYVHPPFENVNVYPLMCRILGIQPAPCDGNLEEVEGLLLK